MLLNRHNLEIRALASKDASRSNLQGLAIQPGRTIATNGHALAIVTTPAVDEAEFPGAESDGPVDLWAQSSACIITADAAAAIEKAIPKRTHVPVLQHARVTRDGDTVTAVTTDTETTVPHKTRVVDGQFPDVDHVVPTGEPTLSIGFNCDLLSKALAVAAKCLAENKSPFARFDFYGPDAPVKVKGYNVHTGQTITVLVMPAALKEQPPAPAADPETEEEVQP